jgi:DNA-binding MarR family transcriptional regulator
VEWPKITRPREQDLFISLAQTFEALRAGVARVCAEFGLSPFQYNALRILRGAGPQGLPCQSIGERMLSRVPDITRLIDRLEAAGLVLRVRGATDRRVIFVQLSAQGLELLARMDDPVKEAHIRQLAHLSREELDDLDRLLKRCREAD